MSCLTLYNYGSIICGFKLDVIEQSECRYSPAWYPQPRPLGPQPGISLKRASAETRPIPISLLKAVSLQKTAARATYPELPALNTVISKYEIPLCWNDNDATSTNTVSTTEHQFMSSLTVPFTVPTLFIRSSVYPTDPLYRTLRPSLDISRLPRQSLWLQVKYGYDMVVAASEA